MMLSRILIRIRVLIRRRRRIYRKMFAITLFLFVLIYSKVYFQTSIYNFSHINVNGYCVLPELDINDEEIMKFNFNPDPITCQNLVSIVFIDDRGIIQFNSSALSLMKLSKEHISCTQSVVERKGDGDIILKPEVSIAIPQYINSDVIVVRCQDRQSGYSYENIHININYRQVLETRHIRDEGDEQMSIFIFGIDSLSRMQALRTLPLTIKYFEEELEGIIFKGYTKVGLNTFPNVAPLLTGKQANLNELPHLGEDEYFDNYPFIFYNFSRMGYTTLFAEDCPKISTFNYLQKGFNIQPTDHYLRPLYLAMKKIEHVTEVVDKVFRFLDVKQVGSKSRPLCFKNTPKHVLLIQYLKRFIQSYKNKLKFSFTWMNELSHDYIHFMKLGDKDIVEFFKWLKREGHLNNSILIFLSDHGSNIAEIRNTASGRIETRLPLLGIALPEWFKRQHHELVRTMWKNTKVITTPFDVNAFLEDVLHKRFDQNIIFEKEQLPRAIGLFHKIPEERTCADASIGDQYCACYTGRAVNLTLNPVQHIAKEVVAKINILLQDYKHICAHLRLFRITHAQRVEVNLQRNKEKENFSFRNYFSEPEKDKQKYIVVLETMPGAALFETMASIGEHDDIAILGEIMRINKYGNQSHCVSTKTLKNYCFCT